MTFGIHWHPADLTGSVPESESKVEERKQHDEGGAQPPDVVAELQSQLAATKAETEATRDRFLRKAAEFENYRKRSDKEKADAIMSAKSLVLLEFLPIVDACERALVSFKNAPKSGEVLSEYKQGVELLYKQVLDTLHRLGVVPIEAEGRDFDPNLHEALAQEETSSHEENTVIQELRRGYLFKNRLLRPAQVKVAARPSGEDSGKS